MTLAQDVVDLGDEDRIARAGDEDAAPARGLGPFELHRVVPGGLEAAARHAHAPVGHLLVPAVRQVERAAGTGQQEGMGLFVERVGRHRGRGAALGGIERLDLEMVAPQIAHDVAADRLGAERAAFHDLAHVPGERRIEAGADRHRRGRRGIVGAAAHHDVDAPHGVGAFVERLEERLGAHLRHHDGGGIDLALVERRHGAERLDAAGLELARDVGLVDIGIDRGELEAPAALAGDIGDDVAKDIDMQVGAVAAGRGDQQREPWPRAGPRAGPRCPSRRPRGCRSSRPARASAGPNRSSPNRW